MTTNLYEVLGVSRTASAGEIKQAYRTLARKLHPDLNGGDRTKEEKFKIVSYAYEMLASPKKRQEYDSRTRSTGASQSGAARPSPFAGNEDVFAGTFEEFLSKVGMKLDGDSDQNLEAFDRLMTSFKSKAEETLINVAKDFVNNRKKR